MDKPNSVLPERDYFKFNEEPSGECRFASLKGKQSPSEADSEKNVQIVLNDKNSQIENCSGANFKTPDQVNRDSQLTQISERVH